MIPPSTRGYEITWLFPLTTGQNDDTDRFAVATTSHPPPIALLAD